MWDGSRPVLLIIFMTCDIYVEYHSNYTSGNKYITVHPGFPGRGGTFSIDSDLQSNLLEESWRVVWEFFVGCCFLL